jgi:hypothetical protein
VDAGAEAEGVADALEGAGAGAGAGGGGFDDEQRETTAAAKHEASAAKTHETLREVRTSSPITTTDGDRAEDVTSRISRVSFSRRSLFGIFSKAARGAVSAVREPDAPRRADTPAESHVVDDALEILVRTGPEYAGGFSNHGPMVVDALAELGRPGDILPWVERYRGRLEEAPTSARPIDDWRKALGDYSRLGDWTVFFRRAIADASWREVLSEWIVRLAPAAPAAAFHGLLRTAHAARSLGRLETPARTRELADALAYWTARYKPLPDTGGWRSDGRLPSEAIGSVPVLPAEERPSGGSFSDALEKVGYNAAIADLTSLIDSRVEGSRLVSDLAETFANVYVTRSTADSALALLHGITGTSAVRLLLPHADHRARAVLLRYAWQTAATLYAIYAGPESPSPEPAPVLSRETLVDRALASGDEHAIKLVEVCLRENDLAPRAVFLTAALDGASRFTAA